MLYAAVVQTTVFARKICTIFMIHHMRSKRLAFAAAEWDFNSFAGTPLEPDLLGCVKLYMVVHKV